MTREKRIAAVAAALLAAAGAWLIWPRDSAPPSPPERREVDGQVAALQADLPESVNPEMAADRPP